MNAGKLLPLVVCLLMLLPGTGRGFELEGYAGFYRYDGSMADEFKADSSPIFGARFGSGARQIISGETTIAYGPAEDIRIILLMGNFLINVPVDLVVPYVTLGTGTTIYLPDDVATVEDVALDSEVKFTLNYGGGFRYFLNNILAVRFDVRDYVTFDLGFDPKEAATGQSMGIDLGTIHNMVVAGGLSLTF